MQAVALKDDQQRSLGMIDQMGQWYEVDVLGLKADALTTVAKAVARRRGGVAANRQVAFTAEQLADQALGAANLRAADRLLKTALSVARRLRTRGGRPRYKRRSKACRVWKPNLIPSRRRLPR